jgi:hypothetical protein
VSVPLYGSNKNHWRLWVIIEGEKAGRYCKAVMCPKMGKNSSEPIQFTVVLADVKEVDGLLTTVINEDEDHIQVYPTHVAAVWQPDDVKDREPNVYLKFIEARQATVAKRRAKDREDGKRVNLFEM